MNSSSESMASMEGDPRSVTGVDGAFSGVSAVFLRALCIVGSEASSTQSAALRFLTCGGVVTANVRDCVSKNETTAC
jgi:hypothetical protein